MKKPLPPCNRDCPNRSIVCHDPNVCLRWKTYIAAKSEYYEGLSKFLEGQRVANSFHMDNVERTKREIAPSSKR